MEAIMAPILIFFIIFNLVIYHKFFTVFYGDLVRGFGRELVASFFIAVIETAIFIKLGGIILIIGGVVLVIGFVVKKINKTENDNETENSNNVQSVDVQNKDSSSYKEESKKQTTSDELKAEQVKTIPVSEAMKIIKSKYSINNKFAAVKEFRELTGLGLKESKEIVDQILGDSVENYPIKEDAKPEENNTLNESDSNSDTEKKIYCSYCGKQILMSAKFCYHCGKENNYDK